MPGKTIQYWLTQWDDARSDAENVLHCLNEYINDTVITIYPIAFSWVARARAATTNTRIPAVKEAILNSSKKSADAFLSTEYILAWIKKEINNYQMYWFCDREGYSDKPELNQFAITKFHSSSFHYKVIAPNNRIETGEITSEQLVPYASSASLQQKKRSASISA